MTKSKTTQSPETPPVKPWCFHSARVAAKKFGARENWPRERREARTAERRNRKKTKGERSAEEWLLIAETKMGGIDAKIARAKLRALKVQRHESAEGLRAAIYKRLERLHAQREQAERKQAEFDRAERKQKGEA